MGQMKRIKISRFNFVLISNAFLIIFLSFFLNGCKSPGAPEVIQPAQYEYRDTVEFVYKRDRTKIIIQNTSEVGVSIRYFLWDPMGETYAPGEVWGLIWGRMADVRMEKIGKYKFRTYFKHVQVLDWQSSRTHSIILSDNAVSHPIGEKDIRIEGAYDITVGPGPYPEYTTLIKFRMSEN
jgi:hypothetical protein